MISAPIAAWTVTGTSRSRAASSTDASRPGERRARGERPRQALAHTLAVPRGRGYRRVHLRPGLLGHPEGPVREPALHVLAGPAERGELEVVNRGRAVERDVGHDPAGDQSPKQRSEPDLDHVPADQEHDPAAGAGCGRHALDDRAQIARGEHVGQAGEERGEGAVGAGGHGEERGIDLVAPLGDGDWS